MVFQDDGGRASRDGVRFGGEKPSRCVIGLLPFGRRSVRLDDSGVAGEGGLLGGKGSLGPYWWWRWRRVMVFARMMVTTV